MKNSDILSYVLWIVILSIIAYGFYQMPKKDNPHSEVRDYYDRVLVHNTQMLIHLKDEWSLSHKMVWRNFLDAVYTGELVAVKTDSIPEDSYPFRLIAEGLWDARCYLDFESGTVYLNKIMEAEEEDRYTVIKLGGNELALLKDSLENNLLIIQSEKGN